MLGSHLLEYQLGSKANNRGSSLLLPRKHDEQQSGLPVRKNDPDDGAVTPTNELRWFCMFFQA